MLLFFNSGQIRVMMGSRIDAQTQMALVSLSLPAGEFPVCNFPSQASGLSSLEG